VARALSGPRCPSGTNSSPSRDPFESLAGAYRRCTV
jgi:hypothetical protein